MTDTCGNAELEFLTVHPDHRNKGIATSLVGKGVEIADQLGLDIYALCFEGGFRTCKKFGFEIIEQLELDDSIYGGAGVFHRYFIERKSFGKPGATQDGSSTLPVATA